MTTSQKTTKSEASISAMDAINHRHAVRDYAPQQTVRCGGPHFLDKERPLP
jgi:hypothetical protein